MYTFNMIEYAEMYRNERLREAATERLREEIVVGKSITILVILGKALTGLGIALTTLGTYLTSQRSA